MYRHRTLAAIQQGLGGLVGARTNETPVRVEMDKVPLGYVQWTQDVLG